MKTFGKNEDIILCDSYNIKDLYLSQLPNCRDKSLVFTGYLLLYRKKFKRYSYYLGCNLSMKK